MFVIDSYLRPPKTEEEEEDDKGGVGWSGASMGGSHAGWLAGWLGERTRSFAKCSRQLGHFAADGMFWVAIHLHKST